MIVSEANAAKRENWRLLGEDAKQPGKPGQTIDSAGDRRSAILSERASHAAGKEGAKESWVRAAVVQPQHRHCMRPH